MDLTAQIRLLHFNRDYVTLAVGDYIVSGLLKVYDVLFDRVSEAITNADKSADALFLRSEFVYKPNQVEELIDSAELDNKNYIYNPRILSTLDWNELNQKLLESDDLEYLLNRGVSIETIKQFKVARICDIPEEFHAESGARVHPAIRVHRNTIPEGYCFPVFDQVNGSIIGSICHFQNLMPEIKWCASIPCYYLYGNLHLFNKEAVETIYICEGVFDGLAFEDNTIVPWISLSSGFFSEFQYINLLLMLMQYPNVDTINLVMDSDAIGIMSMYLAKEVLEDLLQHNSIQIKCYLLPTAKDPGEHFCRDHKQLSDMQLATDKMLISTYNDVKRYTEPRRFDDYLEARKNQRAESYNYCQKD